MPYRVFISHSSRDRWIAGQIDRAIKEEAGAVTFLDDVDVAGGDRISESVRNALRESDEFLLILSSASATSDWVKAELGAAWVLGKRIIVLVDKLSPRDIPDVVSDYKAFDLNDVARYLTELKGRVSPEA